MKSEIKNVQNQPTNWDKRQIVKSNYSDVLILTTGKHEQGAFSGVVIFSEENELIGEFRNYWEKEAFRTWKGELALKND